MTIDRFVGEHAYLSNFWPCELAPVPFGDGSFTITPKTIEHAFQAAKAVYSLNRERILNAETPLQAKRMGRNIEMRPDWDTRRIDVMRDLLAQKFSHLNEPLVRKLLATHPLPLVEGNHHGDTFWGTVGGQGMNWLGCLLMARREQLRTIS